MAKTAAIQDGLYVNGYDLSGDTAAIDSMANKHGEMNSTGINALARERLRLLGDGELTFKSMHTGDTSDSGSTGAHKRLRDNTVTRLATYLNGTTPGNLALGLAARQFTYKMTRGEKGDLFYSTTCRSSDGVGLEIGRIVERDRNLTAVGNASILDLGASHGWLGAVFHLHVVAFTGTSVTLLIQDDDNSGMSTPATFGTFAVVSGRTYERLVVADAPERYIRVRANAGTFSSVTFTVTAFPTF